MKTLIIIFCFPFIEGSWQWTDGTEMSWNNFFNGEPNNWDNKHHCLTINKKHWFHGSTSVFKWSDEECGTLKKIICEKPKGM